MFISKNEPDNFGWHDAEIKKITYENEDMIWKVDALNVLSSNSQNPKEFDCCVSTADVIFKKYQYGKLIEEQSDRVLSLEEISELLEELSIDTDETYIAYIYAVESCLDEQGVHISCEVDLMTGEDSDVCFEILCDELIVKWNEFLGKP